MIKVDDFRTDHKGKLYLGILLPLRELSEIATSIGYEASAAWWWRRWLWSWGLVDLKSQRARELADRMNNQLQQCTAAIVAKIRDEINAALAERGLTARREVKPMDVETTPNPKMAAFTYGLSLFIDRLCREGARIQWHHLWRRLTRKHDRYLIELDWYLPAHNVRIYEQNVLTKLLIEMIEEEVRLALGPRLAERKEATP